jgi:hypothetical protein
MSLKKKLKLALVFIIIIISSFITNILPSEVLGDYVCEGGKVCMHINCVGSKRPPMKHYGFRHWVIIVMVVTFTIISIYEISTNKKDN